MSGLQDAQWQELSSMFLAINAPDGDWLLDMSAIRSNQDAARRVANPFALKKATKLQGSDRKTTWVVTVIVPGPGEYLIIAPEEI